MPSTGRGSRQVSRWNTGALVAAQALPRLLVLLVCELAFVAELAQLPELRGDLVGRQLARLASESPPCPRGLIGVDAEPAETRAHACDADASDGEAVGLRARERSPLNEAPLGG